MAEDKSGKKMIAVNREVRHEYFVIEALDRKSVGRERV